MQRPMTRQCAAARSSMKRVSLESEIGAVIIPRNNESCQDDGRSVSGERTRADRGQTTTSLVVTDGVSIRACARRTSRAVGRPRIRANNEILFASHINANVYDLAHAISDCDRRGNVRSLFRTRQTSQNQ